MNLGASVIFWAIGFVMQDPGTNAHRDTLLDGIDRVPQVKRQSTQKIDPAIVTVYSGTARGTGFFIEMSGNKYLVTAAHVCGANTVMVSDRGVHRILVSRTEKDICVASTYQGVATLELGDDPKNGDAVSMTGFPGNLQYDYQTGIARDVGLSMFNLPGDYYGAGCPLYSAINADGSCTVFVTTTTMDILARGGNSGGPVQGSDGKVVGIIIGTDGTHGYSAPISELKAIFEGRP